MKVLVTVASTHGSTTDIGTAIGSALRERGFAVTTVPVEEAGGVESYDAVVVGSAVYAGHWLKPARRFVQHNARLLSQRPVWLFSSGPVGDPPKPEGDAVDTAELVAASHARGHRVFGGKLERSRLGFAEKAICTALRVQDGDYRDFNEIRDWGLAIADALQEELPYP